VKAHSLVAVVLLGEAGFAQEPVSLVANGSFANGTKSWTLYGEERCRASVVDSGRADFPKALHLELNPEPGSDAWSIQLQQPVDGFITKGDRLQIKVWMRSPTGNKLTAYLQIPEAPYAKPLSRTLELTPDWQEVTVEGAADADYSPGGLHLGFHLGFAPGTVEMTGVRALDLDLKPETGGERPTVDKPQSLISNGDLTQPLQDTWPTGADRMRVEIIDAQVGGFTKAARLTVDPEPNQPPWNIQWAQPCRGYIRVGDAVYFRAWLRSPDRCQVTFIWELARPPHTKYIDQKVRLTPEWQECRFMGRAGQGFRPEESRASLFVGHDKGVIEVAGLRVDNFGDAPDTAFDQTIDYWGGREHNDDWRPAALARIEQIRKGDLTIRVVDANGRPVPGCSVHVQQKRHYFHFGTAAPAVRFLDQTNPDNLRFQQEVERLYNVVTFENDLKWAAANPNQLALVDRAVEWLWARDIDARGHCLLWGSYQHLPPPFRALRGAELLKASEDHVAEYAGHMRGKLYLWDVVNEAGSNTELWDEIGWESFPDSFRWAREADPDVKLCYNDYGIVNLNPGYRAQVRKRIEYLVEQDAPFDALGIQGHMSLPLTPMHTVLEILDEWATFGKDLEITEFDLGCPNDEVHAQYVRDFMTAVFSHPKMTAFIMWGFWEGSHWRGKDGGAMFRRDWTPRPAQTAWEDLVLRQWWTNADAKTGDDGTATLRASYGTHEVTAERHGVRASVTIDLVPGTPGEVQLALD
jgi:GH35 family endo-1,4-beta-xylanase